MKSSRARSFPDRAPGSLCSLDFSLIVKTPRLTHVARFSSRRRPRPLHRVEDYSQWPVSPLTGADGQNFSSEQQKNPATFSGRGVLFFSVWFKPPLPPRPLSPVRWLESRRASSSNSYRDTSPQTGNRLTDCGSLARISLAVALLDLSVAWSRKVVLLVCLASAYFNSLYTERFTVKRKIIFQRIKRGRGSSSVS
jgi:hypothetical protein